MNTCEYHHADEYEPGECPARYEANIFGRQFLSQLRATRSMVELASTVELRSLVKALIKSGRTDGDELVDEMEYLVGPHIRTRLTTVIREGQGQFWALDHEDKLEVLED